jgi:hypothetical protein
MGSLSSVVGPIISVGAKAAASAGSYGLSNIGTINQLNNLTTKNKQLKEDARLQRQRNLLALQEKETDRVSKLNRSLSTQRARFGSQGVGSVTGSADSVIQGINEDSDIQRQNNQAKTNLDNQIVDQNYNSQRELNLLQKQQLQQKSALGYLTGLFE